MAPTPPPSTPVEAPTSVTMTSTSPVTIQQQTDESWSGFFRAHFSVFVLLFMVVFMFGMIIHATHHTADSALIQFLEGHSQTFVGALVGALTTGGASQLVSRASSKAN
jgi:hypothetical protein